MIFGLIFLFGIVMGIMLIAYEDGKPFALYNKLKCKLGIHKTKIKFGSLKINKYYCRHCRKPRKHPALQVVQGGNKIGETYYKF